MDIEVGHIQMPHQAQGCELLLAVFKDLELDFDSGLNFYMTEGQFLE